MKKDIIGTHMHKDFLFFNYSWVPNSTLYFNSFIEAGYNCDIVDENSIYSWEPHDTYKVVIMYLHDDDKRPKINYLLENQLKDSFLVWHNDTDHEQIQYWTNRRPGLVMQRELSDWTENPYGLNLEPFHFPIPSMYDALYEQINDVMFYACYTNSRRTPFIDHVKHLAENSLKHLKWDTKFTGPGDRTPVEYKKAINQCKIGLHYFGNSRDSIRIWEIASVKAAIIMPELKMMSVSKKYMPFTEYQIIRDDFADLEEKILYLLENDRYKELGKQSFDAFNERHSPVQCCKYYQDTVKRYAKI